MAASDLGASWGAFQREFFATLGDLARRRPTSFVVVAYLMAKFTTVVVTYALLEGPERFLRDLSMKWDGEHYVTIAKHGYDDRLPGLDHPFAFAPLFPFLVRIAGAHDLSPLLVANVASVPAIALVTRLMGVRAGLFLALFPTWLVYSTVGYTESTYVLFAAGALLALRAGHFVWSGVTSAYAVATRYPSVLAFLTFVLVLRTRPLRAWIEYTLPALVVGGVLLYFFKAFGGSYTAYLEAEALWGGGGGFGWPWDAVGWLLHAPFTNQVERGLDPSFWVLRNVAFIAIAVYGLVSLYRHEPDRTLLWYSVPMVILAVFVTGFPAFSLPRILLMAFPALAAVGGRLATPGDWVMYGVFALCGSCWVLVTHLTAFFS